MKSPGDGGDEDAPTATRLASAGDIRAALAGARAQHLYRLEWKAGSSEMEELGRVVQVGGGAVLAGAKAEEDFEAAAGADVVVVSCVGVEGDALRVTSRVLELVQAYVQTAAMEDVRLCVVTQGAVSTKMEEGVPGLSQAGVWGLVRTAQTEHGERAIQLVDVGLRRPSLDDVFMTLTGHSAADAADAADEAGSGESGDGDPHDRTDDLVEVA